MFHPPPPRIDSMNDVDMIATSNPAAIDQLPVDVIGQLLLLLDDDNIQCMRLVCQAWLAAVDHQLRAMSPLHLPKSCSAVFSSCEVLHAGIVRYGGQQSSTADAEPLEAGEFSWAAPTRNFNSLCSSMQHVAELDLSGQQLPGNCITLLSQHMTRLKLLTLDASRLPASEMLRIAAFAVSAQDQGVEQAGLNHLSLAGVHLVPSPGSQAHSPPAGIGHPAQGGQHSASASAHAAGTSAQARSSSRSHASVGEILSAIATNALTHLDLSRTAKCGDLLSATGRPQTLHAPLALPVLGRCNQLSRLQRSLVSLKLIGNTFNADDWHTMCNKLTLLTELHMSWDAETDDLSLNATVFQQISRFKRLQSLRVHFKDGGLVHEPYTLTPLAQTLTGVHLSGIASLSMVLSLTDCSSVRQLTLQDITGVAGTPESVVQVLVSMPLLQELQLVQIIQSPMLERAGMCHFGDYLLSQLDCCCPHLTKLVMPDAELNGTGIRLAATTPVLAQVASTVTQPPLPSPAAVAAAAAGSSSDQASADAPSSEGLPGSGALRRLRHLELNVANLMASALPHMSCLVNLRSLTLWHLKPSQFTHACRFDCFRFVSALTNLTSLNIPRAKYTAWNPDPAGAVPAAGAAALGAGGGGGVPNHPIVDEVDDFDIDLLQPFHEAFESESLHGSDSSDSGYSDSDSDAEWEDAFEGDEGVDLPEAAPPAVQQQQQLLAAPVVAPALAAVGQQGLVGVGVPPQQLHQQAQAQLVAMEVDAFEQQQQQQDQPVGAAAVAGVPGAAAAGAGQAGPAAAAPLVQQAQMLQQLLQQGDPGIQNLLAQLQAGMGGQGGAGGAMPLAAMLQQGLAAVQDMQPLPGEAQELQAMLQQVHQGLAAAAQGAQLPPGQAQQQQMAQAVANAQAVGGAQLAGGQQPFGQVAQQAMQQAAAQRARVRMMEPHLHFLARLQNLECLNLGCLNTKGPCLMHLNSLTRLQTLVLSGRITLSDTSTDLLSNLRLPSVKHLSLTECRFEPDVASSDLNTSGSGSSSTAGAMQEGARAYPMDRFVRSVLCAAFPSCQDLRLGCCDKLSIAGLAVLLQQLPKLQRLWLVGCLKHEFSPLALNQTFGFNRTAWPANFSSIEAGWAGLAVEGGQQAKGKQQGRGLKAGTDPKQHMGNHNRNAYPSRNWGLGPGLQQQQQQQQRMGGPGLVSGYILPYAPLGTLDSPFRVTVSASQLAWVVEEGVLVPPEGYTSHATATAAGASTSPAAAAAAAAGRGVPEGAVVLPCVAVSGLKYVSITDAGGVSYRFTRYMDRMVGV